MKKNWLISLALLLLMASCGKVDLGLLEKGKPYVGLYHGDNVVVVFDQVSEDDVSGRVYIDQGAAVVDPVDFSFDVSRKGRGHVRYGEEEMQLKLAVSEELLEGKCGDEAFELCPYVADSVSFRSFYKYPSFRVLEESSRVYAKGVSGFWTSYPDTREGFGAIYLNRLTDLAFAKDVNLDMDLYYPLESSPVARPLLVLIHGGAFYNGDKRSVGYPEMGQYFARRGFVVASINYRLGFRPTSQSIDRAGYRAVQDAHAAVRYLLSHAKEFQISPDHVFVAGTSAGAITALNLAFMREKNRPDASRNSTLMSDLGPIESVNPDMLVPFEIQAVVNMWGAVHDLSMLANSKKTSVLSFHGDQDRIVPYDYGSPFHEVFASPIEDVFRPMYGSKPITDELISLGGHAELHTCHGGGHSLHVDDYGNLSSYFTDTILPTMTRFLCEEMAGGTMVRLVRTEPDGCWFEAVDIDNVAELHWQVEGGAVVDQQGKNKVKALFFGDVPMHSVILSGKYKNEMEFKETINLFK